MTGLSSAASLAREIIRLHRDEVPKGSFRELGFLYGGPAAVGFLDWIMARAVQDRIDHILFVTPSGHLLEGLMNLRRRDGAEAAPRSCYFIGSHVAFTLASMTDVGFHGFLPFLVSDADGLSPDELFARIGVPAPADHVLTDLGLAPEQPVDPAAPDEIRRLLDASRTEILKVARRNRRGLLRHLLDCGVEAGARVAFVDIGWDGTTQETFERALEDLMPLEVTGYYLCLADSRECARRRRKLRMKSLAGPDTLASDLVRAVCANRVAGEFIFSAPHGPVIGYEDCSAEVKAIEYSARGLAPGAAATQAEVAAGVRQFAAAYDAAARGLGVSSDPSALALPLLEWLAEGRWAEHPLLATVRNFDAWAASRNRDTWLRDHAVPGWRPAAEGARPEAALR